MLIRVFVPAVFLVIATQVPAQGKRPMVVDDLFDLQTLGDVRMSPDGSSIAVVIQRAWSNPETFRPYTMFGNDHGDIWVMSSEGGAPRNITNGAAEGAGYWDPVWSPDGQRIALLSTRGGDNVRLYLWDVRSERLRRLTERGVNLRAGVDATGDGVWTCVQWIDNRRLLVTVLPAGDQPVNFRARRQTQRIASASWRKAFAGKEPTASVLESGLPPAPERADQLLLINVETNEQRILAEGAIQQVMLAPDREHVAVLVRQRPPLPGPGEFRMGVFSAPSRLGVVSLRSGSSRIQWLDAVANPMIGFGSHPHRWSPGGSKLAVLAADSATGAANAVFVVSMKDGAVNRAGRGLVASALAWSNGEHLLVRGRPRGGSERSDWWTLGSTNEHSRNLTEGFTAVPSEFARSARANEMIALADSSLWSIDVTTGVRSKIRGSDFGRVAAVVWPGPEDRVTAAVSSMIVRAINDSLPAFYRVDVAEWPGRVSRLPHPNKAVIVAAYHAARNMAVFAAPQDHEGTFLWTNTGGGAFALRVALNRQLEGIVTAERRLIEYRSSDSIPLNGLVLLPIGYVPGKRYPVLTWVYPGFQIRDTTLSFWVTKNQAHPDNLNVVTARGYVVLMPSMPGTRAREDIPKGVLPAVDRLVELGIADPDRVAIAGQSGGGSVTYSLITQTNRFKAAIAINGVSNAISAYGTFNGERRYVDDVDEIITGTADGGRGAPPWKDPDTWMRNSPITFIDRVQTPLLIIHGDIDYLPIQQAEEVFTSLTHLGKRVRFVRYWGESHGVTDSPANVRDRWRHILTWLDTYLRTSEVGVGRQ